MLRKTYLAAVTAALLIPTARGQDLPSGSLGGQTNPVTGGQVGTPGQKIPGTRGLDTATTARRSGVSDQLFATAAAAGGLAEMNLSQLGLKQATDPDLKSFSQSMVDEHAKVNQELKTLTSQKGITMSTALDARSAFCSQSLAGLRGEEFDRCYAKAQLVAHMEAVAMYQSEAERGMDNEVKAFAARTLPHLKDHLKTIKPIAMRYEKDKDEQSPESRPRTDEDTQRTREGGTPKDATGTDAPKNDR